MGEEEEKCSPVDKKSLVTILADLRKDSREIREELKDHAKRIEHSEIWAVKVDGLLESHDAVDKIMSTKVDKIHDIVEENRGILEQYLPMWKAAASAQKSSKTLHEAVKEKSIVGIVWGVIVFTLASAWHYIKYLLAQTPN